MPFRTRRVLAAGAAALALAIPAIAQVANTAAPAAQQSPTPAPAPASPGGQQLSAQTQVGAGVAVTDAADESAMEEAPPPPVEYPDFARRDPFTVGVIEPADAGLGTSPWGASDGAFLETLMRRMDVPLASRWLHIELRDALLSRARSPNSVNPVDWVAERAWLLLRMGEADAARMIVAGVDSDRFTPKMVQVAVQTALATSDPAGLCPVTDRLEDADRRIAPLVRAMCSALAGEPESATAQIANARRRGPIGGIDLGLAQKVVGAASDTGTAATIEWEPVESLTAWRYGLSTATAMDPPERLLTAASPQVRAWHARAPLISLQSRLESARIAAGLGVFSSQSLIDFYSELYDATDPNELGGTDSWQLRLAFAGRDLDTRLGAMRHLWGLGSNSLQKEASRAMLATAAARIPPDADLQADAPELIASMLAAGLDKHAQRWSDAVTHMDDKYADRCWAMLALAAPDRDSVDLSEGRVENFIEHDTSANKKRSQLLVAGLAALGRIDLATASRLNSRYALNIERTSNWTAMIDAAAERGQAGTVLILAGTGFQAPAFDAIPSAHMFHTVAALRKAGLDFTARMIAAEALART